MDLFRTKSPSSSAANTSRYSLVSSLWSVQVQVQRENDVTMDFHGMGGSQQSLPTCCPNKVHSDEICPEPSQIQMPGTSGLARSKSLSDLRACAGQQTMELDCCQQQYPIPMDSSSGGVRETHLRIFDEPAIVPHQHRSGVLSQHQRENICDWLNRLSVNEPSPQPQTSDAAAEAFQQQSNSEGNRGGQQPPPPPPTGPFRRTSYA